MLQNSLLTNLQEDFEPIVVCQHETLINDILDFIELPYQVFIDYTLILRNDQEFFILETEEALLIIDGLDPNYPT
jgi:hypothetical protein